MRDSSGLEGLPNNLYVSFFKKKNPDYNKPNTR